MRSLCAIDAQVTILQMFVTSIAKCGSRAKMQYEVTLFFLIRSSHASSVRRAIYRHKETA
jgi:hypothetical protein